MKYLKLFEGFESKKRSFDELHQDDIITNLLTEIDKNEIRIKFLDSFEDIDYGGYHKSNMKSQKLYGDSYKLGGTKRWNITNGSFDENKKSIILEVQLEHPWGGRSHSSFSYSGYAKHCLQDYFKRFHEYYNVDIFYIINDENSLKDPFCKATIVIQPSETVTESTQPYYMNQGTNLLIIDVQKSFSKFFTDIYVHKLQEYCKSFTNVYQIWDNHVDGKNVDSDYLYDKNPDMPVHNDLYTFPNQKDIIEKRYQYDVDADFYKKILDKDIYKQLKKKESEGLLRRGDIYVTKEETIIVYIGNKHVWYHVPKKLYDLFIKLKGQEVTMVGGSDQECFLDVEVTAKALGVVVKRNNNFIYSGSYCPIK